MKIKDNVYLLDASRVSHVYLIADGEITLVDTGLSFMGKGIVREIESMGIELPQIRHILLTHHDVDHVGNLSLFSRLTGAEVWASREDIPVITGEKERHGFKKYIKHIFPQNAPCKHPPVSGRRGRRRNTGHQNARTYAGACVPFVSGFAFCRRPGRKQAGNAKALSAGVELEPGGHACVRRKNWRRALCLAVSGARKAV
jgi:hypothetical protein